MAGDDPAPASGAPPIDYNAIIQQIMQGSGPVTGPAAPATPAVNPNLPITSLLGEAFGGGVSPLYPMSEAQQTQAGNAALLNFGINMLQNSSGPVRHSLGQAIASGLLGAQGSLAGVREGQAQTLEVQNKQQLMRLEQLKEVLPLLRMQQAAGMPNSLLGGGGTPSSGLGATGAPIGGPDPAAALPKDQALAAIVQRESGGRNVNTEILDPQTGKPASTASGYYQMVDGTWQEAARLAGLKNPPPRAIDASRADQDAAASALYDKRGLQDWARSAPATAAPAAPAPYKVASTGATPPPPSGAFTAPATAADDTFFPTAPKPNISTSPTLRGPGSAVPPTVTPPSPTIAQAGPPTVTPPAQPTPQQPTQGDQPPAPTGPMTIEQYRALHPITLDPATYTVPPPDVSALISARNEAARQLTAARAGLGGDPNKSLSDYNTAAKAVTDAQQGAASKSLELQQAAQKDAEDRRDKAYGDELTRQQAVAEADKQRAAAIALKTQEGQQAIALEQARGRTADESKVMDSLNETRESARTAIDQLGLARSLSQQAGDPTFWQTVQQSHPQLVQALANMGALNNDQVTQLGYAGASDAAMNKLISMARTGSGFQRMTNLDVQILSSQAPKAVDPQAWRDAKMDYLQTYMARQMQYVDNVRSLRADGTPLYEAQKRAAADTGDIVPQIPNFTDTPQKSAVQQRIEWAQDRLSPNTFFRAPDGKLVIYRGPQAQTEQQTTAPAPTKSLVPVN